jgi:hypothetical protein
MGDFIADKIVDWTVHAVADAVTWLFNAVPPLVPLILIPGALLIWASVAAIKWMRSTPNNEGKR